MTSRSAPRSASWRSFYTVLVRSGSNDVIAYFFDISLNATTWMGRIGVLVVPPLGYYIIYRICLGCRRPTAR